MRESRNYLLAQQKYHPQPNDGDGSEFHKTVFSDFYTHPLSTVTVSPRLPLQILKKGQPLVVPVCAVPDETAFPVQLVKWHDGNRTSEFRRCV